MGFVVDFGNAAARSAWEKALTLEIRGMDPLLDDDSGLLGSEMGSLVRLKEDLKDGGKQLTVHHGYQLRGDGVVQGEQLVGNEEGMQFATDTIALGTLRHAVGIDDEYSEQVVSFDVAKNSQKLLADWAASRLSLALHAHAAGNSLVTSDKYRIHNAISLPSTSPSYVFRPNGKAANALTSSDIFDVNLIRDVAQFVQSVEPIIRPAKTPFGDKYCVFISPEQARDLRDSDSEWYAAMTAALQGGNMKSGVFTRALGEWEDFIIFVSNFISPGLDSDSAPTAFVSNTRRAWVGGADALAVAFGRGRARAAGYDVNRWAWTFEERDYGEHRGIGIRTMAGVNKFQFTDPRESTTHENVVVIETYVDHGQQTAAQAFRRYTQAAPTISIS